MSESAEDIYKRLKPRRRRLTADGTAAEETKPAAKSTPKTSPKPEA